MFELNDKGSDWDSIIITKEDGRTIKLWKMNYKKVNYHESIY